MLLHSDKINFDIFYNDMILQFPKEELKSKAEFKKLIDSGKYDILSAFEKSAYVFIVKDIENSVIWLDYLAVMKNFHSKGYGKRIMESLKEYYPKYYGCYLEVEKPDENVADTIRRINFYKNLGAVRLNCDYFYPNENGYLPMDLYYLPFDDKLPQNSIKTIENIFNILHSELPHIKDVLQRIKFYR